MNKKMSDNTQLKGLGGWLITAAIIVVLSIAWLLFVMVTSYPGLFKSGLWSQLTTPGGEGYHPLIGPAIIAEIFANVLLLLGWIYSAYLLLARKTLFPKSFILMLLASLIYALVYPLPILWIKPGVPVFTQAMLYEIARWVILLGVWIPYMQRSERVKNTFIG